jgi:hypothetical protein
MPSKQRIRKRVRHEVLVARYKLRKRIERMDSPEVRNARRLLKAIRAAAPPDVVYVGDSTASFTAPGDSDKRNLAQMVGQTLARRSTAAFAINGGSYHAELIASYLRLLQTTAARPVLIVPLWIRGRYVPWIEHPVWGHQQAMHVLRGVEASTRTRRVRGGFPVPPPEAFARYYGLQYQTILGDQTIGEYVRPLKDLARWDDDEDGRVRLLHGYHHGARLVPGSAELDAVVQLGSVVGDLGCPVVAYQTPVPVESGVHYFGDEFAQLARDNFATLDAAFLAGLGRQTEIIQSGMIFPSSQFIDTAGADEHLNEAGRLRLTELIVDRVLLELDARKSASPSGQVK